MSDLTNEAAEALGRRWLAAGGGWRAGMLVQATMHGSPVEVRLCYPTKAPNTASAEWPDLRDPATLGACLAVVRERWGSTAHLVRHMTWVPDGKGDTEQACWWALAVGQSSVPFTVRYEDEYGVGNKYLCGPTEEDALVRALEAAPKVTP